MGDIFAQNKTLIERLYQGERKTLKQVKEILERDHNFPPAPLSIYETRLRNVLKLRKKFKKEDWPVIYHHYGRRNRMKTALYLHGVKYPWAKAWKEIRRSGARQTRIDQDIPLPHGVELRTPSPSLSVISSSPRNADLYIPPSSPTRTSSLLLHQEPSEATSTLNRNLSYELSLGSFTNDPPAQYTPGGVDIGTIDIGASSSRMDMIHQRVGFHSSSSPRFDAIPVVQNEAAASPIRAELSSYIKLRLEYLPWQNCRLLLYSMVTGMKVERKLQTTNGIAFSLIPRDYFSTPGSGISLARMCDTVFPNVWHLSHKMPVLTLASTKFEVYHFLAQAIYLLSNKLLHYEDVKSANLIDTIFFHTPRRMIHALFEVNHISIQAAWEGLVKVVVLMILERDTEYGQNWNIDLHDVILCLVTIGMGHPNWVVNHENDLVKAAISFSDYSLLRQLLDAGACAAHTSERTQALSQAIIVGSIRCVKVLVEQCDLNFRVNDSYSHFATVLEDIAWVLDYGFNDLEWRANLLFELLDILIEAGADVHSPFTVSNQHLKLLEDANALGEWYPTFLDWSVQRNETLFHELAARCPPKGSTLTRHGVILAARQGGSNLTEYLRSLTSTVTATAAQFLEIVMREQFLYPTNSWHSFDFRVVKSLIDIGVQICPSDYQRCYDQVVKLAELGIKDEIMNILDYLFHSGATIGPEAFAEAVPAKGTGMLELLVKYGAEVSNIGGEAIVSAARLGNGDAVDWLLESGVDIKSEIMHPLDEDCHAILGSFIWDIQLNHSGVEKHIPMLQHLVDCGAELKDLASDQYADGLLHVIVDDPFGSKNAHTLLTWVLDQLGVGFRRIPKAELQALFIGLLSGPYEPWRISTGKERWWLVFDRLYKSHGPPPRPEPILALLIERCAQDELLQKIIQTSANVNTYGENRFAQRRYTPLQAAAEICNYHLVLQLLNLEADVNAPPRGRYGRTALQAVCVLQPVSAEERDRQQDIVSLLIKRGANINAAPAKQGLTAIMASAISGNLELTALLLAHGADPNNYYYLSEYINLPQTVLDMSIERCDITNLLLNAGALSSRRGSTGYEGAILDAKRRGHHAVAKMIRDHIAKQEKLFRMNPELRSCHNAVLKNMDEQDALGRENEFLG